MQVALFKHGPDKHAFGVVVVVVVVVVVLVLVDEVVVVAFK